MSSLPHWQRTLWIMFVAQMCTAIGFSLIFPFLPLYVQDLGTHTNLSLEFWAGMVFSSQAITMMIAAPLWGAVADRYGRKLMVQRAMFGGTIIIFLMAFARSAEELVLLRTIQGAITGTIAAANALVAACAPRERIGYAMGVLQVGLWAGIAAGPLLGGILADSFGFRIPFIFTAALLFISGVLVQVTIKEEFTPEARTANRNSSFLAEWRHILSMNGVIQTYIITFLGGLTRSMVFPIMPLFIAALLVSSQANGITLPIPDMFTEITAVPTGVSTLTGLVVGLASATTTASAVYLGRLGDRIGHRTILIGCATAAMIFYIPQAFVTEAWQLLLLQALTGLVSGGLVASPSALLARFTEPGEEGAVYGLEASVGSGARAIAPLVGAGIAAWLGLRATFAAVGVVLLIVLLVAIVMVPRRDAVHAAQLQPAAQPSAD